MFHYLTLGYLELEPDDIDHGRFVVRKPLDMDVVMRLLREIGNVDDQGNITLGGYPVRIKDGCVICPWLMNGRVRETAEFARRLLEATGCSVFDVEYRIRYRPEKFLQEQ
jgi:hypothetical protein